MFRYFSLVADPFNLSTPALKENKITRMPASLLYFQPWSL